MHRRRQPTDPTAILPVASAEGNVEMESDVLVELVTNMNTDTHGSSIIWIWM